MRVTPPAPGPPPAPPPPTAEAHEDTWVELEPVPAAQAESSPAPRASTVVAARSAVALEHRASEPTDPVRPPRAEDGAHLDPLAPPRESGAPHEGDDGWTFSPTAPARVDLGLTSGAREARAALARRGDAASEPRGASRSGGLVETLHAAEVAAGRAKGVGAQMAVEAIARSPEAPLEGHATFDIAIDRAGKVHVAVTAASSELEGWRALTAPIEALVARKSVNVPDGAKGLRVVVRVEARQQFPDGGSTKGRFGAVAKASPGAIRETKERIDIELPHVVVGYRGRGCGAGMVVAPGAVTLGGGCRESTAVVRVVSSKLIAEERL